MYQCSNRCRPLNDSTDDDELLRIRLNELINAIPTLLRTGRLSDQSAPRLILPWIDSPYSHSIVAGGFELMSYTTRFTPFTSLITRVEIRAKSSYGR